MASAGTVNFPCPDSREPAWLQPLHPGSRRSGFQQDSDDAAQDSVRNPAAKHRTRSTQRREFFRLQGSTRDIADLVLYVDAVSYARASSAIGRVPAARTLGPLAFECRAS